MAALFLEIVILRDSVSKRTMSKRKSPESGQTEPNLIKQIAENQGAIQGPNEVLMPLLVANLERLAEAKTQQCKVML